MIKEDFEKIAGKRIDEETFYKMKRIWLNFFGISKREVVSMFFSTNSETRALFEEGYDLTRELDILYHASALMKQSGLKKGHDYLYDYCVAKEDEYAKKVHAANLDESILKARV